MRALKISKYPTILLLASMSSVALAGDTTIAVASNFTAAMRSVVAEYEKTSTFRVDLVFGSSGKIYAQIRNGAPFQAFFSADQAKPSALEADGLVVPGSRFTYAVGALALWTREKDLDHIDAMTLKSGHFNRLALANPRLAPYGAAARQVLQRLGLDTLTRPKWVQGENIAQTYQFVDTGNAELGFVAVSQIMYRGRVRNGAAWIIPKELYDPIRQDAVLLRSGENSQATRDFLLFFRSKKVTEIVQSFGYGSEVKR